jgi:hypothetical protein
MEHDPKWVRRKILMILKARDPHYVTDDELMVLLRDQGVNLDARDLARELTFLANWPVFGNNGQGYLHMVEVPAKRTMPRGFKSCITPKGLNLLDPTTPDTDECVAEF